MARRLTRLSIISALFVFTLSCGGNDSSKYPYPVYDLAREHELTILVEAGKDAASQSPGARPVQQFEDTQGVPTITLPFGRPIVFYLKLPTDSAFVFDGLRQIGDPSAHLTIEFQRSGGTPIKVADFQGSQGAFLKELPRDGREISKLSLRANGADGSDGYYVLSGPSIRSTQPTAQDRRPQQGLNVHSPKPPKRPNVVLYLVDTVRADHMSLYGYGKSTTPSIDAFAADAGVFYDAVAHCPWTKPSVASIFTGLEPQVHTVRNYQTSLPDQMTTVAEILSSAGYRCDGFIENSTVREQFGFGQGFEIYQYGKQQQHDSKSLIDRVIRFLHSNSFTEPFFLYVHAMDPHAPYDPPETTRRKFAGNVDQPNLGTIENLKELTRQHIKPDSETALQVNALYDAEIAFADINFGRFVQELKEMKLFDDTIIIFTADHGEELWDRGLWGHSHGFHAEQLSVPLIVKTPSMNMGVQISNLVQHADLLPTILDFVGLEPQKHLRGRSLRDLLEGKETAKIDFGQDIDGIYSCVDFQGRKGASLTMEGWKLILPRSEQVDGGKPILINRVADPHEVLNIFDDSPIIAQYLLLHLARHETLAPRITPGERIGHEVALSENEREELRALGYLQEH